MRPDPLDYLDRRAERAARAGTLPPAARPRRRAEGARLGRPPLGRQPLLEQLSRADHAPAAARAGARGDRSARRRHRARSARSPARWRSTWSSSGGSPRSSRPRRRSSSRAASRPTPAPSRRILGRDDVIVSDELNHASIIDGARLSRATIKVFPHRDVGRGARDRRRSCRATQRTLIITDGVFSMDGDLGALPALCDLADEFGCIMMVDDAHASGVFGAQRPRHRRSLRPARPRRRPGRHAVEGDRRARRLRRRLAGADRVPAPPRAAVPVLDVASAVGRGHLPRGARRARDRAAAASSGSGTTRASSRRACRRSASTPACSESPITPVIVGDGGAGDEAVGPAVRARACSRRASASRRCRRARRGSGRSSPPRTRSDELQFRARLLQEGRHRARHHLRSSAALQSIDAMPDDRSAAAADPAHGPLLRGLHAGPHDRRSSSACSRATRRRRTGSSRAHIDFDALKKLPWHRRIARARAAVLPGVHAASSRPARRAIYGVVARRHRSSALVELFAGRALAARPAPGVRARHAVAADRVPAAQPARAARGRRPAVAQERPRDRARDPAGDAAARRRFTPPGSRRSA